MDLETLLKGNIESLPEYDDHAIVSFAKDSKTGMKTVVAIHRKHGSVPSFGATRMMEYDSDIEALRDALRLSRGMSYKAALAGLPCGGAKGVIILPKKSEDRNAILEAYASKILIIKDNFITGLDVGLVQDDLAIMRQKTSNIIGFNANSTNFTGKGICHALRCCLEEKFGSDSIKNKSFAIQGLGKVGVEVLENVYAEASKVFVSDINDEKIHEIKKQFPRVIVVAPNEIHKQDVDVFSPCALSHAIDSDTIMELKAKVIVGGANNQLQNDAIGEALFAKNILYAPDYVANAGGLIAVFDEYSNEIYDEKRVEHSVANIYSTMQNIFNQSRQEKIPTNLVANSMAEKIFNSYE